VTLLVYDASQYGLDRPYLAVFTKNRVRYSWGLSWLLRWYLRRCEKAHRPWQLMHPFPDAGKNLVWEMRCVHCCCVHFVTTPHGERP